MDAKAIASKGLAALVDGTVTATPARSTFCPAKVVATVGTTEYSFSLRGGQWRLSSVTSWGNTAFLSGAGCDASGWIVPADGTARLNEILASA